ncbi:hypothetical protein EZI45_02560 [Delftia tsuruhatensis]|uniref:tape measure protein n=1 Tax=Delftia tsuruhatensis TaxID=180282 RepID=UPI0010555D87|nr:tape measure protein [Delftia tsuruhatensis]TDF32978.1 hypothetical protein EZI45_02560 [Delftia tsuruhatensis]
MATSSRDAKLTLSIESLGQENITKLEKELRRLADTGDASAAEFGQLADEISRLGEQNAALQGVKALADQTAALQARQEGAGQTAQDLAQRLETLRAATDQARAAQDTARQGLLEGEKTYIEAGNALRALKAEYDNAGKQTAEYRSRLQALVAAQNQANLALVTLRDENRRASEAVTQAAADQRKAEGAYKAAERQVAATAATVEKQSAALREAGAAADALGVDVSDLAGAEAALQSTFTRATKAAQDRRAEIDDMAEADRLAAIEAKGLAELYARGEAALLAETAALREAAKSAMDYAAAKARATADEEAWQREANAIVSMRVAQEQSTKRTQEQVAALRELSAQNAFAKQAAEAQKMVQAAEYVRFWEQALDDADRKQQELTANTQRVNDAFKQINVRPIEDIQREIASTNAAMATLAASGKVTGSALAVAMQQAETKVQSLERELRQVSGTMTLADKAAGLLKNSIGQITAGNVIADGIGFLVNKVKELGVGFVTTISDAERLRRGLNAVYKDAQLTGQQMEFLRSTAVGAGVSVSALGPAFLKYAASAQAANIPLQVSNALFEATARSAGTLGLSGEQVNGMLEALSQMAGKGVVSMEELRQQLADRLPGAMSLVAKGLGITEASLIKLVESGQLAARDLFPALTKGLQSMQGEVSGLNVTWENFKNVLVGVAQDAGDAGWLQILTAALKVLGGIIGGVALGLSTLWEGMRLAGVGAVALSHALRGDAAGALEFFNEQVAVSVDRMQKQADRLEAMLDPAGEAATRMRALSVSQQQVATTAQAATKAIDTQTTATATVTKSIEYQAGVTKLLSNATMDLGAKIVGINSLTAERLPLLEKESVAADKMAKATQIQGDALVTMTKLRGSDLESLQAQQKATEANLAAQQKAAEAQRAVTEVLELQRAALVGLAQQEASGLEGRKAELEAIDKKLVQARAENEQAQATVAALKQEMAARILAVKTLQDNSAKVEEFRKAANLAEQAVIAYGIQLVKGNGLQSEYARLQQQAALATGLYRDALADAAAKVQALSSVEQANISLKQAGLSVQQQAYTQLAATARATGDLTLATQYEIEAKRIQIEITRLAAEAKRLEAQATIAAAEAEREELKNRGLLTDAKKLEIEARIINAKTKEAEAKGSDLLIRALEKEISAIRTKGTATNNSTLASGQATAATNAHADAIDKLNMRYMQSSDYSEKQIALLEREAAAAEKAAEAYRKKWNIDKDGFTLDANGQRMQQSAPTQRYVFDTAKAQGLSEAEALALVDQFIRDGQPSSTSQGLGASKDWFTLVNEAINERVLSNARNRVNTGSNADGGQAVPSGTKTVVININGRQRKVDVATSADANTLAAVLRELEASGGTSS